MSRPGPHGNFSNTATWPLPSEVNDARSQPAQRSLSRKAIEQQPSRKPVPAANRISATFLTLIISVLLFEITE